IQFRLLRFVVEAATNEYSAIAQEHGAAVAMSEMRVADHDKFLCSRVEYLSGRQRNIRRSAIATYDQDVAIVQLDRKMPRSRKMELGTKFWMNDALVLPKAHQHDDQHTAEYDGSPYPKARYVFRNLRTGGRAPNIAR